MRALSRERKTEEARKFEQSHVDTKYMQTHIQCKRACDVRVGVGCEPMEGGQGTHDNQNVKTRRPCLDL
jgi:hypothetical protein